MKYYKFIPFVGLFLILYYLEGRDYKDRLQLYHGYTSTGVYIFFAALIQIVSLMFVIGYIWSLFINFLEH